MKTMENSFIIDNLLQQEEGIRLEFKAKPDVEDIARSITSFINTHGGDLVIGIDNNKNVIGVEQAEEKANHIKNVLIDSIKPIAPISLKIINYKKRNVILISVWEGAKKPYQFKGVIYNRNGSQTRTTNPEKLNDLILERKQSDFHWERMPVLGAEIEDLDIVEINKTIDRYKDYRRITEQLDEEDFLVNTGLMQNGNLSNACIVSFGNDPIRYIPQSRIRITLYPTKSSGDNFIDDRIFEGNIFKNISAIFEYIDVIYGKSYAVNKLIRSEKSNYPRLALREGILNAIVHRDYNSVKGFLQISIYSDRTEISNYGKLPKGITIEDLKVEHSSILRNPDVAQMCFYRRYIEMLGSGTQRMIRDCRDNKFKLPIWKETDNVITVTFPGLAHNRNAKGIIKGILEGLNKATIAKLEEITEGITEGITDDVRDKIIKILIVLYKEAGLKTLDIEKLIDIPAKSIERYIKQLKDSEIIEYRGAKRTGGYYLTDVVKERLGKEAND